ncbi:MAG: hypothetical protein K9K32_00030 [Halanaerobiales bacterium]|nr:hypothetical protein [Halanaerobiales bacterium]
MKLKEFKKLNKYKLLSVFGIVLILISLFLLFIDSTVLFVVFFFVGYTIIIKVSDMLDRNEIFSINEYEKIIIQDSLENSDIMKGFYLNDLAGQFTEKQVNNILQAKQALETKFNVKIKDS